VIFAEQDKVEVPDPPPIDVEDRLQDRLVEFVVATRVTVSVNPFNGDTLIVEVPAVPVVGEALAGLAVTAKSWTWNVTVEEWDKLPLVPVTVAR
jgi:hypothetical protein